MICKNILSYLSILLFTIMISISSCPVSVHAAAGYDKVAGENETASSKEVKSYGMVPVHSQDIEDGSYEIEMKSSSSFFRTEKVILTVKKGKMTALLYMYSSSYTHLYMGSAEDAAKAGYSDYIASKKKSGYCTFTIPVEDLNAEISCAAFSKKKSKWYDRTILFDASTLSDQDALKIDLPDYDLIDKAVTAYNDAKNADSDENSTSASDSSTSAGTDTTAQTKTEAMKIDYEDGEYSIDVDMTGGSGRASISSPTLLVVQDGKAYAELTWSSTYYDYMIVGGTKYENQSSDGGNSTFLIPISTMDEAFPVIADTTAMGDPVEIEYQLTFYSDSIGNKNLIPQEAAKRVLVVALIMIVIGFIINRFFRRSRYKV